MHYRVHYQNLENSRLMDQFIDRRIRKLDKYLTPSSTVQVNLRYENRGYVASVAIHSFHQDFAFLSSGGNMYESFTEAIEKATRVLGEQKRKLKDKINKRFFSLKHDS